MNHLKEVIKLLGQALGLTQEDIEEFEFEFEQLEGPGLAHKMTEKEWEKFRYYQENPPQTEEEKKEYQELWGKAQQAVAAFKRRRAAKLSKKFPELIGVFMIPESGAGYAAFKDGTRIFFEEGHGRNVRVDWPEKTLRDSESVDIIEVGFDDPYVEAFIEQSGSEIGQPMWPHQLDSWNKIMGEDIQWKEEWDEEEDFEE